MPFIPHTAEDVGAMLAAIGVQSIDELFDEIPPALRSAARTNVAPAMSEMEVARLMHKAVTETVIDAELSQPSTTPDPVRKKRVREAGKQGR